MGDNLQSKQLMIGLPGTGKTTFLAALWQVVTSDEVPGALRLVKLDTDSEYVDQIHEDWLAGQPVERTNLSSNQLVSMKLSEVRSRDEVTELIFPDMSGELFNLQWLDRNWSKEYELRARQSTGVILFVHPRKVFRGELIDPEIEELVATLGDREEVEPGEEEDVLPFDQDRVPTQVKVVELLQFLTSKPYLDHLDKLAVIVSAWDLVEAKYNSPEKWMTSQLPLLDQYLRANQERFNYHIYGVSAQGGEIVTPEGERSEAADQLVQIIRPSERIKVKDSSKKPHHDITVPIKWLMGRTKN